jgi:hypothetical protein
LLVAISKRRRPGAWQRPAGWRSNPTACRAPNALPIESSTNRLIEWYLGALTSDHSVQPVIERPPT